MNDGDKDLASKLILEMLNSSNSTGQNFGVSNSSLLKSKKDDPLDLFLSKCGISTINTPTITNHLQPRSNEDEIIFYCHKVQETESFEQFWNTYQHDLPRLVALVRAYNIRPATSVASESLFSIAGYVHRKQRSSLSANSLRYSMVLRDRNVLASLV